MPSRDLRSCLKSLCAPGSIRVICTSVSYPKQSNADPNVVGRNLVFKATASLPSTRERLHLEHIALDPQSKIPQP